jgi:nucleoside-diphosphate-sugar epimerase
MTRDQPPSEKENALKRTPPSIRSMRGGTLKDSLRQNQFANDEYDGKSSHWPINNDDDENLHYYDTVRLESKAKYGAQVALQRRYNNRFGRKTNNVIGQSIKSESPSNLYSASSYILRTTTPHRCSINKRRKFVIYSAIGLVLFGYFFELMQLIIRMGNDESSRGGEINLPAFISNTLTDETNILFSPITYHVIPNKEEWDRVRSRTKRRAEERRKRSRPPNLFTTAAESDRVQFEHSSNEVAHIETAPRMTLHIPFHRSIGEDIVEKNYISTTNKNFRSTNNRIPFATICGIHALNAAMKGSSNYPSSAHISRESRVVVTGALSQLGMEIILRLYEDCGAGYIMGIDSALPNTRHDRLVALERYRFLSHHVPSFQKLHVPLFGIAPRTKSEYDREFDVINVYNATHIIHLMGFEEGKGEYVDFGDTDDVSPFNTMGHSSMMRRFQNLVSMDQILSSIARFKRERSGEAQPQFVYVSSTEVEEQHVVPLAGGRKGMQSRASSVYGTCSLLKEVLASYYYRHHGVESVGIRLSTVYGPLARPGSLMHDLAERAVREAVEKNGEKHELDECMWRRREGAEIGALEQMTYASDLAQAFIAAMQYVGDNTNGPVLMQLGSKDTISMKQIESRMRSYLHLRAQTSEPDQIAEKASGSISDSDVKRNLQLIGWEHTTDMHDGLRSMIAWQIMKAYPFVQPSSDSRIQDFINDSNVPYPGLLSMLPCSSGCGWHGKCIPSVWDAIIEETKAATAKCKYVLYTVDLRSGLNKLKGTLAASQYGKDFCKIAFISSSSVLARSAKRRQDKDQWAIIEIRGDESTLTEAELSLAKLSPSKLFGDNVSYAFYFNHLKVRASIDNAMFAIMSMKMNSKKKKERKIFKNNGKVKKVWIQPRSKRHSIMFTSRIAIPEGHDFNNANALAAFVISNFDVVYSEQIKKQVQFYQHASHLVRSSMLRSTNYASNVQENYFPFEYISTNWILHDLQSKEGHQLRCEIYEEHATWSNHNMEDLAAAFVLAKRRVMLKLGKMAEPQYEGPADWYPLLVPRKAKDKDNLIEGHEYLEYLDPSQKTVAKNIKGSEIYISFFSQKSVDSKSE